MSGPTLVLAGTDHPDLLKLIDSLSTSVATQLDVRTGVLWTQVPDGLAFLQHLLGRLDVPANETHAAIRFAFAEPDAPVHQLVHRALMAPTLATLANTLEAWQLQADPPSYEVRYQPLVSLADRSVIGFESLIRARAEGEIIDAEELIARSTRGGWVGELDQLGRTMALRGLGPWLGQGLLFLNVMAPTGEFDTAAVTATIEAAVEAGLEPDQIVLEAVERNRYNDMAKAAAQIEEFRSLGVRIAVDDVGDGFSSLAVVSAFKPDIVKVSGALTAGLPGPEATAVIRAIVQLAHEIDSWVVAENIETEDQARQLTNLGVDWGQGLHLGKPAHQRL
ncbi:MAG: EAL domain-containing protein (putative c-di-GMP-specific phosphodiesterase class I) [Acidimicrobiales bacterium]